MARVTHLNVNHRGSDGATMNADDIPFTPAGTIASTNVQAAIEEVASEAGGGGGSGPFEDVDTYTWKFTSPAIAISATDVSSYLQLTANAVTLRAYSGNGLDIFYGKAYVYTDFGMVVPIEYTEPGGGDSEEGQLYYNANTVRYRVYQNGAWVDLVRGALASVLSAVAIADTETVVTSFSAPAAMMEAGTTFRIKAFGRLTSGATAGSSIFRCRIGTTTLTGNIAATLTVANGAAQTDAPFEVEMLVTVRTAGGSGSVIGNVEAMGGTIGAFTVAGAISANSSTVAVDTTANKLVEFTYISGNAGTTATFENVVLELLQ